MMVKVRCSQCHKRLYKYEGTPDILDAFIVCMECGKKILAASKEDLQKMKERSLDKK